MGAAQQRRQRILAAARENGCVEVMDLAGTLEVAAETVRRDLHVLEGHGLIHRTHGGALPLDTPHYETRVTHRSRHLAREKRQIAAACVEELAGQESVFLDQGSTTLAVAQRLALLDRPLTVVTPSVPIAAALSERPRTDVLFLGGRLRGTSLATVGLAAMTMLTDLRPDVAVMTASGMSLERGASTSDAEAAELKKVAMRSSGRALFVGDHSKFGNSSFCHYAAAEDFDVIITDVGLSSSIATSYRSHGVRLVRAAT